MNLKTYAMTGPVRKRFTKAREGNGLSRGGVDISRDDLRRHRVACGLLGLKHQRVDLVLPLVRRGPDDKGPGHIRVIPVNLRTAVDDKQITLGQLAVTRAVMRQRGVLSTRDDGGEGSIICPPFGEGCLESTSNVCLAITDGDGVGNLLEGPSGDPTGP